jgi:hypothetical protein
MPGPSIPGVTPNVTLPNGWTNLPLTQLSFNATVGVIDANLGTAEGAKFKAWLTGAWAKDPKLTPNQAAATWLTGNALSTNLGTVTNALAKVPQAVATAAEKLPNVSNPLDFLSNIADFFSRLTQANTWLRLAEFVLGGALILVGVAHMAKGTPAGTAAAKAVKTAGLAAAL